MVLKLPWGQKQMSYWTFENGNFQVFAHFWAIKLKLLTVKEDKAFKGLWIQNWSWYPFQKMVSKQPGKIRMMWAFEKDIVRIFANFWVTKLKPFPGKVRKDIRCYLNQNLLIESFSENCFETTLSSKRMFWAFQNGIL